MLEYKASWKGTELVVAPRNFPSSKTCSDCGLVKVELSLSEREFTCESCGLTVDRDTNAAVNLARYGRDLNQVAAGRAETISAGGGGSSGRPGSSRSCETIPYEGGTVLVERSTGPGQLESCRRGDDCAFAHIIQRRVLTFDRLCGDPDC